MGQHATSNISTAQSRLGDGSIKFEFSSVKDEMAAYPLERIRNELAEVIFGCGREFYGLYRVKIGNVIEDAHFVGLTWRKHQPGSHGVGFAYPAIREDGVSYKARQYSVIPPKGITASVFCNCINGDGLCSVRVSARPSPVRDTKVLQELMKLCVDSMSVYGGALWKSRIKEALAVLHKCDTSGASTHFKSLVEDGFFRRLQNEKNLPIYGFGEAAEKYLPESFQGLIGKRVELDSNSVPASGPVQKPSAPAPVSDSVQTALEAVKKARHWKELHDAVVEENQELKALVTTLEAQLANRPTGEESALAYLQEELTKY